MPLVVFGGVVVNLKTLPSYSSWFQYLTPLRYGFNIMTDAQLNTDELLNLGKSDFVRNKIGLDGSIEDNIIMLILLWYGLFVMSFLTLYIRRKFN
jgi:hypothetical protein